MWPSRSNTEFAIYLSQKWSDCHKTKSKHIDWTPGLDAYFFLNLAVGQPSNNMDLSEIEIYLGIMITSSFFSCDQAALQMVFSVCPSVRLSVCPSVRHTCLTMFPSSYHHEICRSHYQWQKWRPCKRSRSEVKGQGHRGHNPTLPFPDCNSSLNSLMMMKWCI